MSTHINAKKGDIAPLVLLPGDPLRARFIAENFLENPVCYNEVRGMLGFTGTYNGKKVVVLQAQCYPYKQTIRMLCELIYKE